MYKIPKEVPGQMPPTPANPVRQRNQMGQPKK